MVFDSTFVFFLYAYVLPLWVRVSLGLVLGLRLELGSGFIVYI